MRRRHRPLLLLAATALLLALFALPGGTADRSASRNLLRNPGFEQGLEGHAWMPAAWDTFESGLNTVFFGRDSFLVHGGQYSVNIANLSTNMPMFHNWSQTLAVGRELWDKDLTFSVWTRSNGLDGRAYILLQAYRDTIQKMALQWGVPRDTALFRMGYTPTGQPTVLTGWRRHFFSERETEWVQRQVKVYVPAGTNIVYVRCGMLGTGQVMFDEASLTATPAAMPPSAPLNKNLLADGGFEDAGNGWDYSLPPFPGLRIERDSTIAHSGRASLICTGGRAPFQARAGVCQVLDARPFWGKRLRLSGWVRTDSLIGQAFIKLYGEKTEGPLEAPAAKQYGATTPWTRTTIEMDVPPGTNVVSGWFIYNCPVEGRLWYDDCTLEVIGTAEYILKKQPAPTSLPLPDPAP